MLEPAHPQDRISYILRDIEPKVVLTNRKNAPRALEFAKNRRAVLEIDSLEPCNDPVPESVLSQPHAYAYVLYTSGSTGEPKGVIQTHRNLLHKTMVITNSFQICAMDRLTLLHSLASNAAVDHLLGALLNGACLFPLNVKEQGAHSVPKWLSEQEITIYHSVPSLFRGWASDCVDKNQFPKLRLLRLGGEEVRPGDVELYKRISSPRCLFVNTLGSNETGPICSYFIDHATEFSGPAVPAGYAVPDTEVLLLDDCGKEVPLNSTGHVAVKSKYLAAAYWRRPDLTAAAFISDANESDQRLYLSGDRGVLLQDGCLIIKGRNDFVVKVRGYSIDVTEVEQAMLSCPGVKDSVVVAQQNGTGEMRLIAYWTASSRTESRPQPNTSTLRRFLEQKLPGYMIPSLFVRLDAISLTARGKIDRRGLPQPSSSRPDLDAVFIPPRTPIEAKIAEIWERVLSLGPVGIHDNFFELGGDSLAALRAISELLRAFHVELPVKLLFESPSVAALAAVIQRQPPRIAAGENLDRVLSELEAIPDTEALRLLLTKSA